MRHLISEPSTDSAVNAAAGSEMLASLEAFEKHARDDTQKFAMN
jgi:hypothetical protein